MIWLAGLALAADPFARDVTVETLDNGLTVIVSEDHRTDTVALHLTYGVGSRDELPGEFGCAHLFEHLMFEGSANVPTNMFDEWLTAAGGSNNAYTSNDVTAYHMAFPSGALDLALFLESDRMAFLEAGLDQTNLDNQQGVVLQERAEGDSQPYGRDWDSLARLIHPDDQPYQHSVIGTVADVEGFQVDGVKDFWQRHYRPRNAVLAVVGAVDTDAALERIRFWFSDVPDRGEPVERATRVDPILTDRHGLVEDDVEERVLWMVWPGVPRGHADEPALDLLANIMSMGRGTRLDDGLYYEKNLATQVGMFTSMDDLEGQVMVRVGSDKTPLAKLRKKVDKELATLLREPPSPQELERARRAMRASLLDSWERPEDVAETLVDCYRLTGEANCLAAEWARYEAVTADDVVRVAQTYVLDVVPNTLSNIPRGDDGAMDGAEPVELP